MATTMSTSSSRQTSTTSLSNLSTSASTPTSPTASNHTELESEPSPAGGLRLRLSAPSFMSDDESRSPPETPDVISRAPSLLPLNEVDEEEYRVKKTAVSTQERREGGAKTKTKSKSKRQRGKSPLLDALKLPPLSEITSNIPRPVQIKFAPLHIPPHRRLQTLAVAAWGLSIPLSYIIFFFLLSLPFLWPIIIPYTVWALLIDNCHERGGRSREWARRFKGWQYFAQYYPCSLVKEADLPPDGRYVFGYHPHGIIGMGAVATFATEATGFGEAYPGIKPHLLTLDSNFKIPIYREILMWHGICSVSRKSCTNILSQGPGNAITIVVGGAAEALYAHPGTNDLTLKKRFGFIKVAIREGASLVPVFSFGENDIYDQLANDKGSTVYKLQKQFQKLFGFTLPLFHGRGIFNYNYGLMPFRHPIVSVIGRPIHVEKLANPSQEYVQEIQKQYIHELTRIWDKYKDLYAQNRTRELTLIA